MYEIAHRPGIESFFKTVWIPDEIFFQSLIRSVADKGDITNQTLTFYQFNNQGKPILIYNDSLNDLLEMPYFFARKVAQNEAQIFPLLNELQDEKVVFDCQTIERMGGIVFLDMPSEPEQRKITHQSKITISRTLYSRNLEGLVANGKPYFIVFCSNGNQLARFSEALNDVNGIVCHGRLFKKDEIQFAGGSDGPGEFGRTSVRLRDYSPPIFLLDLINQTPHAILGCCCTHTDFYRPVRFFEKWLDNVLEMDSNCKIILLENSVPSLMKSDGRKEGALTIYHDFIKDKKFLKEVTNLKRWDQEQILTIPAESEQAAVNHNFDTVVDFIMN
jgi:hypothetical protein